jgi:integrase/recombinase XerC
MNINNFIKYIRYEKRLSEHTINSYETDLIQFRNFVFVESNDDELNPEYQKIRAWIASLSEQGLSAVSINRKVSSLKSYVKYLMKFGHISKNPILLAVPATILIAESNVKAFKSTILASAIALT